MQIPTVLEYLSPGAVLGGVPTLSWLLWKASERLTRHEVKIAALDEKIGEVRDSISELRADMRGKGGF